MAMEILTMMFQHNHLHLMTGPTVVIDHSAAAFQGVSGLFYLIQAIDTPLLRRINHFYSNLQSATKPQQIS
jgi:hypothetical protein